MASSSNSGRGSTEQIKLSQLEDIVAELRVSSKDPEWLSSVDQQSNAIDMLALYKNWAPHLYEEAQGIIRKAIGLTKERYEGILELTRKEEIRRALKYKEPPGHDRLTGEHLYPKDGWLGAYLRFAQDSEVPLAWHFWVGVSVISAACRRNLYIDRGSFYLWPNHYIMLVGPSGLKKDTALDTGLDILTRLNHFLEEQGIEEHRRVQVLPKRSTPERFMQMLASQEKSGLDPATGRIRSYYTDSVGILGNAEIVTLIGRNAHNADGFVHLLTALYTCPPEWRNSTIGRGDEVLRNVALTFVGGSTADWLRESVSEDMFGGGFMGRCVFAPRTESGRTRAWPNILDPVMANLLAKTLIPVITAPNTEMTIPKDVHDYFTEWYDRHKESIPDCDPRMHGYLQRKDGHLLRLALVLAISDGFRTSLQIKDVQLALKILENEERRLPECFGELGSNVKSRTCDRLHDLLWRKGGVATRSSLLRSSARFIGDARDFSRVIETLRGEGRIDVERSTTGGAVYRALRPPPEETLVRVKRKAP